MKKLIKELVEADEKARESLQKIKEERANVSVKIMELKPEIEARFNKEAEEKIQQHKAQLEDEYEKKSLQYSVQYEKSLEQLIDRFNKNKSTWVESIYDNCLNS
ncbi:hypothetical protein [Proteiniclasticum sp.]|uniref:hypothetical protein n=1 Tax=Proteiniclasticum sp. TaxID=2053595 RepID=UPI002896A463|nr:hypothetical protein [Proteiniclasticum sp.]